jgi:putative membrane protein
MRTRWLAVAVLATILMLGGAYTYARVPLGYWIQGLFDLSRNPYDKRGRCAPSAHPVIVRSGESANLGAASAARTIARSGDGRFLHRRTGPRY